MKQKSLQKLLVQARHAGVYRLPPGDRAALEKAAAELGFVCFKVSFDESDDIETILAALGRGLDFPDWYGTNFDALNDCLTDFSWREAPGYVITLVGADALHAADPASFAALNEVFASAIEQWRVQNVPLWIFYAGSANGRLTLPTLV